MQIVAKKMNPSLFGPSNPNTSPSATEKVSPSTAVISPNSLVRFFTLIMLMSTGYFLPFRSQDHIVIPIRMTEPMSQIMK